METDTLCYCKQRRFAYPNEQTAAKCTLGNVGNWQKSFAEVHSLLECIESVIILIILHFILTDLCHQPAELRHSQTPSHNQSRSRYLRWIRPIKPRNNSYNEWGCIECRNSPVSFTEKILPYQVEVFIKLREIEKVLPSTVQDEIKQDLQKLWDRNPLEMINITNALDRGGRVPLPLAGHFEG